MIGRKEAEIKKKCILNSPPISVLLIMQQEKKSSMQVSDQFTRQLIFNS